ncbi:unnamed protein product [Oncorhynchus mykiss]|uniref:TMEM87A/B GOLD domain-containing protein n=1 Tax=Oncorhynchus mykiss TaxID=8022 RepID=A0A060WM86_ONCMY|nr:unnamed protein product [Oncorhynchus mykiss]
MFNNTVIQLKWLTEHCEPPVKLNISWCLRSSRCFHEVFGLHPLKAGSYFRTTTVKQEGCSGFYVFYQYPAIECKQHMTHSEVHYMAMEGLIRKYGGTLFYGTSEISLHLHGQILITQ